MIHLLHTTAPAALTGPHRSAAGMYDVFQNTKRSKADRAVEQLAEVEAAARAAQVAAEEAKREAEEKVSSGACTDQCRLQDLASCWSSSLSCLDCLMAARVLDSRVHVPKLKLHMVRVLCWCVC